MSAKTLPGRAPEPAGAHPERKEPGPALVAGPALPPASTDGPTAEWPPDVHLPDEKEDDEC